MSDTNTHREALARAFFTMRPVKALGRYPELSDAYAVYELLVVELKNADALCDDVQVIVTEDLKIWMAQQLRHGEAVVADQATRASMRWRVALQNLKLAVKARKQDVATAPMLSASQREALIVGAVALREHDDQRGEGPDDGVDVFQGFEVAMGLAMLDYPVDQKPFTRSDLKHAYEEHLHDAGPRVFGNLQAH